MTPEAEAELIRQARGTALERADAFEAVFLAFKRPIAALCLHLTGNPDDAEDAVQEVFLVVHQKLSGFRGDARLYTWIYRIAVRIAMRAKVKDQRRARRERPLQHDPGRLRPDPLTSREGAARVQKALSQLNTEHRLVVSLFAIEELRHEEIAKILGVPVGTVWSRLHTARKKLASVLLAPDHGA